VGKYGDFETPRIKFSKICSLDLPPDEMYNTDTRAHRWKSSKTGQKWPYSVVFIKGHLKLHIVAEIIATSLEVLQ
jgi:hypothetical protein